MNAQKILRSIVLVGIFLIPFIPLVISSGLFFPFITGKNFTFRVLVEIIAGSWLILAILNPAYRPKRTALFIAVGAFTVITLLAGIFGVLPYKSLWSNYERMEGFVTIAHLALYFLVAATTLTRTLWERLIQTNLFVSLIIAIYGFVQLGGGATIHQGGTRVDASLGNATYLAVYMLVNIFFALYFLAIRKGAWNKFVYGVSAILNAIILYHTATRGAMLGLLGGLFVTTVLMAIFEKKKVRTVAITGVVLVLVVIGGFLLIRKSAFVSNSPVLNRFASISLTESTTKSRFLIWNMAWSGFKERPLLGWGQENFNYVFNKNYSPEMYNQEQWFDRTHNVVLDWLIAGGILGFLSYLALFGTALYLLWRRNSHFSSAEKSIITGLFVGYFIHNLFVFDNLISYILFFTILGFISTASHPDDHAGKKHVSTPIPSAALLSTTVPIVVVLTIIAMYYVNVPAIQASRTLIASISPGEITPLERLELYKKVIQYNSFGTTEAREQFINSFDSVVRSNPAPEVRDAYYQYIKSQVEAQLVRTPNDARYQLFAGTFYSSAGEFDNAIARFENALKLSPNKQQIMFQLGAAHIEKKDFAKGLEVIKKAYDLAPGFDDAKVLYAIALIYSGKNTEATAILKDMSSEVYSDQRIINAYINTKQYAPLRAAFEQKVKENPEDAQLRVSLAAIYLNIGDRANAIKQLQEVARLFPEAKAQMDAYIEQIRSGKNPTAGAQ